MRRIDWQSFLTTGVLSICLVALCANRVLVYHFYGNQGVFSSNVLLSIWLIILPDLFVLLILYTLLVYIGWKYPQYGIYGILLGLCYAIFVILVSTCNIIMLTVTGRNIEWKIVFEVDFEATYSLYTPHVSSFISLLISYFLLGCTIWSVTYRYIPNHIDLNTTYFQIIKFSIFSIVLTYMFLSIFDLIPPVYGNLSSNMALTYFPEIIAYHWKAFIFMSFHTMETVSNAVVQAVRAPSVNISQPLVILKKPVQHVCLIILESVRADTVPLNQSFAKAVRASFSSGTNAAKVTPFLNSLWENSVRTTAWSTSSYTLKSLVSIFCGIYPLLGNFLKEIKYKDGFYEKCLPELLHDTFRTKSNQSKFHSAIFTTARGDFDHQQQLFQQFQFDKIYDAADIYEKEGYVPDVGMFGPEDTHILPLVWKWLDDSLAEAKPSRLFMSLLATGTHEPFTVPDDYYSREYQDFIDDIYVNSFLNALHISDRLVSDIIQGFKRRHIYDNTLFIIVSDHGYVFNDHGSQIRGLLSNPLEPAFSVPLMFHNPHLIAKSLTEQFSTMDILPTIMDILLSSTKSRKKSMNRLLSVSETRLQSIFSRYEGRSILRMPVEQQAERLTFSLANPGGAFAIARQYPRKLSYDVTNDEVHLYHLGHDPTESTDLLALNGDDSDTYPPWIDIKSALQPRRKWKGRWARDILDIDVFSQILSNKKEMESSSMSEKTKLDLNEMMNWAEQTFELTRLWTRLINKRYYDAMTIFRDKKTAED
ncbi:unnamed protein product [Adineta ricciae]|uniref:Sulfatase N-terminal domain-containing protein n=2 Tax=Adineta ricciae TaxID=249248 RepID=A0A814RSQ6_ADIRI|nr:unnamed protein product [Adineta ricciae]